MDEREDRYAGMEPQEEERREDPVMMGTAQPSTSSAVVYSNFVLDQRQQYQQQANGSTNMIRQDYNGGGHQFNAQHTRPPMMSNGNPNLSIQSPQYQQQHQYRPQQSVVQTRAPMPQTRPQFNSMPPSNIPRQQQQYHKPQQPQQQRPQQLPASFHHRVDPNPSSVGYYEHLQLDYTDEWKNVDMNINVKRCRKALSILLPLLFGRCLTLLTCVPLLCVIITAVILRFFFHDNTQLEINQVLYHDGNN
jgi:hypothetical protein